MKALQLEEKDMEINGFNKTHVKFNLPDHIVWDKKRNCLYVTEKYAQRIRCINLTAGSTCTLLSKEDGVGVVTGLVIDPIDHTLIFADHLSLRRYDVDTKKLTPLVRRGVDANPSFQFAKQAEYSSEHLAIDPKDGTLYMLDGDHRIRRMDRTGLVEVVAGSGQMSTEDGPLLKASFWGLLDGVVDSEGCLIVVTFDSLRKIDFKRDRVSTIFKADTGKNPRVPRAVVVDGDSYLVSDGVRAVARISSNGSWTSLAGCEQGHKDGTGTVAQFHNPWSVAFDTEHRELYVVDQCNHCIRKLHVPIDAGRGCRACGGSNCVVM